jgi:hypothetical protein
MSEILIKIHQICIEFKIAGSHLNCFETITQEHVSISLEYVSISFSFSLRCNALPLRIHNEFINATLYQGSFAYHLSPLIETKDLLSVYERLDIFIQGEM